jgi:hypothetical protein
VRLFAELKRYAKAWSPPQTGLQIDTASLGSGSTRSIQRSTHSCGPISRLSPWRKAPFIALFCGLLPGLSGCGGYVAKAGNNGTLVASASAIAFGNVSVGQTASGTVLLLNESSAPLQITQLGLTGKSFSVAGQNNLPITVSTGATYSLNVQFVPAASGAASGQLTVTSNSSTGSATIISLNGTGVANAGDVATLVPSPGQVTFGNVSVGQTASATVLLSNQGSAPLQITQLGLTGPPFSVADQNNLPISVAAGGTYSLNVQFDPAASGTASGQLTVTSNSSTGNTTTIGLSGTGVANATDVATLVVSPATVAFGNVSVGQTASATVLFSNQGSAPLQITKLSLNGQPFSFAGQNNLPIAVAAGATYSLNLHFDPAASGSAAGQLTVTSNSSTGDTTVISLGGTGIASIATVSIGNTRGQAIPANFMGLSHEWGNAQNMIGDSTTGVDNIYRQLLRNLTAYGSGPIQLRIGGSSTDNTGEPTPTTAQPFAELASALGARFYLGVNLGGGNVNLAVDQAKAYVSQMPAGSLDAIEIGNEPDGYPHNGMRSPSYAYNDYLADFNTWKTNIMPVLPTGTMLVGPSWAGFGWWPDIKSYDSDEARALTTFSQHFYVASGKAQNPGDILLTPSAATNGPNSVAAGVATAHQSGIPFRMGEMNSLSNGGEAGISNAFESALWAIDTMFEYANVGVDGVNWHGGGTSAYTYFDIPSRPTAGVNTFTLAVVNPLYYGLLFFQAATGNGAHLLPVTLDTQANLKAWATIDSSGTPRLVLVNKDENLTGTVDITLNGYSHAQIYRLTAPTYQSTSGVTFAGQTFDGSTNGVIQGAQTVESVDGSDGVFEVSMPITSAALVVFTN